MDYNFNGQYSFTWPRNNPYQIPNGYPVGANAQTAGSMHPGFPINQPIHGTTPVPVHGTSPVAVPGFNSSLIPGCRIGGGIYPFGINGPFPQSTGQNPQFPSSWNFAFNSSVPRFNQVQAENQQTFMNTLPGATTNPNPLAVTSVSGNIINPIDIQMPKQNESVKCETSKEADTILSGNIKTDISKDDLTEEIALKVSTLLSSSKIINSSGGLSVNKSGTEGQQVQVRAATEERDELSSNLLNSNACDASGSDLVTDHLGETFDNSTCDPTVSALSRTSSGSSVESITTPLKFLQKDSSTGEYIVKMSPEDFNLLSNQKNAVRNDVTDKEINDESATSSCHRKLIPSKKRARTVEQKERAAVVQNRYYERMKSDPEFKERNREKVCRSRQKAQLERSLSENSTVLDMSLDTTVEERRNVKQIKTQVRKRKMSDELSRSDNTPFKKPRTAEQKDVTDETDNDEVPTHRKRGHPRKRKPGSGSKSTAKDTNEQLDSSPGLRFTSTGRIVRPPEKFQSGQHFDGCKILRKKLPQKKTVEQSESMDGITDNDVSLGLSSGDMDYLNKQNIESITIDEKDTTTCAEESLSQANEVGFITPESSTNNEYSGTLVSTTSNVMQLTNSPPFVQVGSSDSVQLVNSDLLKNINIINSPTSITTSDNVTLNSLAPTQTTPTVTAAFNDMSDVAILVDSVSKEGMNYNMVQGLDLSNIVVPIQVQTNGTETPATSNSALYVISMTLPDENTGNTGGLLDVNAEEVQVPEKIEKMPAIIEPQKTSTPKLCDDEMIKLNDTILAGDVPKDTTLQKENIQNSTEQRNAEIEGLTSNKQDEKEPRIAFTNKPIVTDPLIKPKPCRQIQLQSLDPVVTKEKGVDDKSHNKTYCDEWVSKTVHEVHEPNTNMSLAQSSQSSPIGDTSVSSLNVTSVSRNVPEQEKFVNQRVHLQKKDKPKKDVAQK